MTSADSPTAFRERLMPGPWLFLILLLILPAVMLAVTPINAALAVPAAVVIYALVAGSLMLGAPVIAVEGDRLVAGRAQIPVSALGGIRVLGPDELRAAIGPGTDARSYLLVRGYIHTGVSIEVDDPQDPTPRWILTSRRPQALAAAIEAARGA